MDWRQQADRNNTTVEQIKKDLPLEWVVVVPAGIKMHHAGEGRLQGLCPFHSDEDPSFDIYGYGERWGCFPCGRGGDIFDFIGEYWELVDFSARFEKALELLSQYRKSETGWKALIDSKQPPAPVPVDVMAKEITAAQHIIKNQTIKPVEALLQRKGMDQVDLDTLARVWRLGVTSDGEVLAPYYNREGELVSYKTRYPGRGGWYARKGARLTSLYGEWQLKGSLAEAPVWLCEGETDTWLAWWLLRGQGVALGLPAGASSRISNEWVEIIRDKRVTLVMDADKAGRTAAKRWWDQIHSIAAEVVITFPESDLCDSRDPEKVLHGGKIVPSTSGFVVPRSDGRVYQSVTANGPGEQLSNFVFEPVKRIRYLDTLGKEVMDGFEGHFADETRKRIRIQSVDFETAADLRNWAIRHGRVWTGSAAKHPQSILADLQSRAPFLKEETAVPVAGLWGAESGHSVFVLPHQAGGTFGSAIGREKWSFFEGNAAYDVGGRYRLGDETDRPVDVSVLRAVHQLHDKSVMIPLIAWMASAPLRSLCKNYPPLAVLGGSGSGKTTLTLTLMELLWGWTTAEMNLTNSTGYAVKQASASVNGLPIWWDEHRQGARKDALEAISQVARDSWTGSVSQRGGMGDDKSKIQQTAAVAPLIISGEAGFEEKSLIDRTVMIRLPLGGRNSEALETVMNYLGAGGGRGVIGRRLVEWQLKRLDAGDPLVAAGAPYKKDRQEQGLAVLEWGWAMWKAFLWDEWEIKLDWSLDTSVVNTERDLLDESPEITALIEMLQQGTKWRSDDKTPVAWIEDPEGDIVCVRKQAFHNAAKRDGFVLPGGATSTGRVLEDRFPSLGDRAYYTDMLGDTFQVRAIRLTGFLSYLQEQGIDIAPRGGPWSWTP